MQRRKRLLWFLGIGAFLLYFLIFPQQSVDSVREGMQLCLERLAPALFPYLVLSNLFLASGGAQSMGRRIGRWMQRVFRVGSGGVIALLLGLTGGYPLGAKTAAALCRDGIVEQRDAERLLLFCNNAGPAFLFGVVGAACYRSTAVGAALYAAHILSALLCGLLLRGESCDQKFVPREKPLPPFSEAFVSAVSDAGRTLVTISLLVTVFTVLLGVMRQVFHSCEALQLLLTAVLELSSGCIAIASSSLPWSAKLSLTAAAVGWGGFCVHLQTVAALQGTGLSVRPYLRAKALQAALSALIVFPVSQLISPVAQTFSSDTILLPISPMPWCIFSCGMICLIFLQFTTSISDEKGL